MELLQVDSPLLSHIFVQFENQVNQGQNLFNFFEGALASDDLDSHQRLHTYQVLVQLLPGHAHRESVPDIFRIAICKNLVK